jgi:flavin-dependent dehydrogenase
VAAEAPPTVKDVVVIGGGPAGSCTAGFLAQAGRDVLVCEREVFPRFHIGESLLPASVPVLERLGVAGRLDAAGYQRKWGARFVFRQLGREVPVEFGRALGALPRRAWHVRRADFDHLLLNHAAELGAEVRQGVRVRRVRFDGERAVGVELERADGSLETVDAAVVVDASGRDTMIGAQLGTRERDPVLRQAALYAHYSGHGLGIGREGGDIVIVVDRDSWWWLIPLDAETISVGLVLSGERLRRRGDLPLEVYFDQQVAAVSEVAQALARAQRSTEVFATADYSYSLHSLGGPGWLAVGDAGAFLDPIFSSGVHLALVGGQLAAATIDRALQRRGRLELGDAERYERAVRRGLGRFRRFVLGFYDPVFARVYTKEPPFDFLRRGIVSILGGRVFDRHLGVWFSERAFLFAVGLERRTVAAKRARQRDAMRADPRQTSSR